MIPNQELVCVWKQTEIPVHVGQRLVGLRTPTHNYTVYLYDHDGERPGWISGDILRSLDWEPSREEAYLAVVTKIVTEPHNNLRFHVRLAPEPVGGKPLVTELQNLGGWPSALGEDSEDIRHECRQLYDILSKTQPQGTGPFASKPFIETKEPIMSLPKSNALTSRLTRTAAENGDAMKQAAFIEAGGIVNKQLSKLAALKAPLLVRGYVETPIGRLVIANLFSIAIHELRPDNSTLRKLADAGLEAAYLEVVQAMDIDSLIDELLSIDSIKRAMSKVQGEKA